MHSCCLHKLEKSSNLVSNKPSICIRTSYLFGLAIFVIYFMTRLSQYVQRVQPTSQCKQQIYVPSKESYEAYAKRTCSHIMKQSNILNNNNLVQHIKRSEILSQLSGLHMNYSYAIWRNHAAVNRVLTPCDHTIGMNIVRAFTAFCERHNITYWMTDGSLLGSIRHWDVIPWDLDFDFFVPKRNKEFLERQFTIEQHEVSMSLRPGSIKVGPTRISPMFKEKPNSQAVIYPFIDLFYYDENSTHICDDTLGCYHPINKSVVFPLQPRPLGSLWLFAPYNPLAYFKELHTLSFLQLETMCHVKGYTANTKQAQYDQPLIVICETLSQAYPFVRRDEKNVEQLVLDGKVLQTLS